MNDIVHLILVVTWLLGAVTGGVEVQRGAPAPSDRLPLVAQTDWAGVAVRDDEIVLAVGRGSRQWRATARIPSFAHTWLHGDGSPAVEKGHTAPLESATFIPL